MSDRKSDNPQTEEIGVIKKISSARNPPRLIWLRIASSVLRRPPPYCSGDLVALLVSRFFCDHSFFLLTRAAASTGRYKEVGSRNQRQVSSWREGNQKLVSKDSFIFLPIKPKRASYVKLLWRWEMGFMGCEVCDEDSKAQEEARGRSKATIIISILILIIIVIAIIILILNCHCHLNLDHHCHNHLDLNHYHRHQ